jgi:hypothetical protein
LFELSFLSTKIAGAWRQARRFDVPATPQSSNRIRSVNELVARHMHATIGVVIWFVPASDTGSLFDDYLYTDALPKTVGRQDALLEKLYDSDSILILLSMMK